MISIQSITVFLTKITVAGVVLCKFNKCTGKRDPCDIGHISWTLYFDTSEEIEEVTVFK